MCQGSWPCATFDDFGHSRNCSEGINLLSKPYLTCGRGSFFIGSSKLAQGQDHLGRFVKALLNKTAQLLLYGKICFVQECASEVCPAEIGPGKCCSVEI